MDIKVSVIIPVYNAEKSIMTCVNSVRNQTYQDIEIVCVDDGSKDASSDIIRQIQRIDSRVKLYVKDNGGVSSARNLGLSVATGDMVMFLDSDDAYSKEMVAKLVEEQNATQSDIVICGYLGSNNLRVTMPGCCLSSQQLRDNPYDFLQSTYLNPPWNKLFARKELLPQFNERVSLGEDLIFNIEYISRIETIRIIPDMLYVYSNGNEQSLSLRVHDNAIDNAKLVVTEIDKFVGTQQTASGDVQELYALEFTRAVHSLFYTTNRNPIYFCKELERIRNDEEWNRLLFGNYCGDNKNVRRIKNRKYFYLYLGILILEAKRHIRKLIK